MMAVMGNQRRVDRPYEVDPMYVFKLVCKCDLALGRPKSFVRSRRRDGACKACLPFSRAHELFLDVVCARLDLMPSSRDLVLACKTERRDNALELSSVEDG